MTTTLGFKDILDLPEWRSVCPHPAALTAGLTGASLCSDLRNSEDRLPWLFLMVSGNMFAAYNTKNDGWIALASPALGGSGGAASRSEVMPARGPRGTIAAGCSTTSVILSTALPAAVGVNALANRGDGRGFRVRIVGNSAGGSGRTEERLIVANSSGTTPTLILETALSFTPASGDAYEFLSGRVYLMNGGSPSAGQWKYYDVLTNSYSGNLSVTNLPSASGETHMVGLDELLTPCDRSPGDGYLGELTATGSGATSLTGHATGGDAAVLANEWRNFQLRIVQDTTAPTAAGQRRKITSHTAGPSPVYTVPAWSVTPSTDATFVIENANEILYWYSGATTTYTYAQDAIGAMSADTWSTSTYAARSNAIVASGATWLCSGPAAAVVALDVDKNFRYSHIMSFRGGSSIYIDIFDIAAAATGTWSSAVTTRMADSGAFAAQTAIAYDPVGNNGCYAYLRRPITTAGQGSDWLRINVLSRTFEGWAQCRWPVSATAANHKAVAVSSYFDGDTTLTFLYGLVPYLSTMVQCVLSR